MTDPDFTDAVSYRRATDMSVDRRATDVPHLNKDLINALVLVVRGLQNGSRFATHNTNWWYSSGSFGTVCNICGYAIDTDYRPSNRWGLAVRTHANTHELMADAIHAGLWPFVTHDFEVYASTLVAAGARIIDSILFLPLGLERILLTSELDWRQQLTVIQRCAKDTQFRNALEAAADVFRAVDFVRTQYP